MRTPPVRPIGFTPIHYSIPLAERKALMESVKAHGIEFLSTDGGHSRSFGLRKGDATVFVKTVSLESERQATSSDPLHYKIMSFLGDVKMEKDFIPAQQLTSIQAPTLKNLQTLEKRFTEYEANPFVIKP